jgi:hypothetical protein
MTRLLLAISVGVLLFQAPLETFAADETAAPAAQAKPAAPKSDGCMPGGGCCGGSAACPAAKTDEGKQAGGCPCQKAKQAAAQQKQSPAAP